MFPTPMFSTPASSIVDTLLILGIVLALVATRSLKKHTEQLHQQNAAARQRGE